MAHLDRNFWLLASLPPVLLPMHDVLGMHLNPISLPERQEWSFCWYPSCLQGRCFSLPCSAGKGGAEGRNERGSGKQVQCNARSAGGHLQGRGRHSGLRLVPGSKNLLILLDRLPVGNVCQDLEPEHCLPYWSSRSGVE